MFFHNTQIFIPVLDPKVIPFLPFFTTISKCASCIGGYAINDYDDGVVDIDDIVIDDLNRQGVPFNAIRATITITRAEC